MANLQVNIFKLASVTFVAVSLVVFGDTAGKVLTGQGVAPGLVAWSRFALAAVLLFPFVRVKKSDLMMLRDWRVMLRGCFISGGIFSILTALKTEPIANVYGAFFIGPIVSYALACLFMGEEVSRSKTVLLLVGFVGVLMVVQPGIGMSPGILFALLAGCCYGCYLATTRLVAGAFPAPLLLISQLMIGSLLLAPVGVTGPLLSLQVSSYFLIGLSAIFSAAGNYLLVLANRWAEATLIAPLVYSQLISATFAGLIIFGDWPDPLSLVGLLFILVSGFGSLMLQNAE
jgi:drug/metabolite transporter (DMT)-like permease